MDINEMNINEKIWSLLRAATKECHPKKCAFCEAEFNDAPNACHVDHIFPKSIWPERELDPFNTQLLCPDCNRIKGTTVLRRGPTNEARIETSMRFTKSLIDLIRFQQSQLDLLEKLLNNKGDNE
jgi:5-methylcytosine-specific restriction endonuclease McrA